MKTFTTFIAILVSACFTGCALAPTKNFSVPLSVAAQKADVLEIAIDVARSMNLPPVGRLDKANGIVEFGNFTMPEIGIAVQVRVRSDHTLDVTLKRTSVYVPLPIEDTANEFKRRIEARLAEIH